MMMRFHGVRDFDLDLLQLQYRRLCHLRQQQLKSNFLE
jgi:hypothetical protein